MGADLLGIGVSALNASQRALDTIGHNLANVNTPHYSRQVTEFATRPATKDGAGFIGTGVSVQSTRRVVDQFLNYSLRTNITLNKELQSFSDFASRIDSLIGGGDTGLSDGINKFYAAMQDLANRPSSISARQVFIAQAQVLESRINELDKQVELYNSEVSSQISGTVTEINGLTSAIAQINIDIVNSGFQSTGQMPNDLFDQRDKLVNELAELIGVSTVANQDGSLSVFTGQGQSLVLGGTSSTLGTQRGASDSTKLDVVMRSGSATQVITNNINSGKLGGVLNVQDSIINPTLNAIGRIAITMAMSFNAVHEQGIDLNGDFGEKFFTDYNLLSINQNRVTGSQSNTGNGSLSVSIDAIGPPSTPPYTVHGTGSTLVNAGTLSSLDTLGKLNINGVNIRATIVGDDTVSSSDTLASSIATANAINATSALHKVTATPLPNSLYLGGFTPGAYAAGEFQINGVNVVTTGADATTLVNDINSLSTQTGVLAQDDGNGNITLVAQDGRNIQLTSNTNTPVATFTNFDTNSAVALDTVQRGQIELTTESNQGITIAGSVPTDVGFSAGVEPAADSDLTISDYQLQYDGSQYTLTRLSDSAIVAQSLTPNISVDGFTLQLDAGTIASGDSFIIKPTRTAAKLFNINISDPAKLALASPVAVSSDSGNQGNAKINLDKVINTTGQPASTSTVLGNAFETPGSLSPPIEIRFITPTMYRVFDMSGGGAGVQIGPDQSYDPNAGAKSVFPITGVVNTQGPGTSLNTIYDPGYRVSITGSPQANDVFSIDYNHDAINDNRNANLLTNLQTEKLMSDGSATIQESMSQLVGEVGSIASRSESNYEANTSLLRSLEAKRNNVSAVNKDEEAAALIKFEQAYQAAARLISVSQTIFDSLISAFGR